MVFSRQLDDPNTPRKDCCAFVVPCKTLVNSLEDLVDEARRLWRAEADVKNGRISATWGCVALLENPKGNLSDDLRNGWTTRFLEEPPHGALSSARGEASVVDDKGFLTIAWPRAVDDSDIEVDALLATATDQTLIRGDYPSAREIAAAWNAHEGEDYERYVQYFRETDTVKSERFRTARSKGACAHRNRSVRTQPQQLPGNLLGGSKAGRSLVVGPANTDVVLAVPEDAPVPLQLEVADACPQVLRRTHVELPVVKGQDRRHERVELRPLPRRLFDIETARLGRTIDIDRHDDLGNRRVSGSQDSAVVRLAHRLAASFPR